MSHNLQNWAGSYTYQAKAVNRPTSIPQIQELVRRAGKVRALGTRHSFNDLADSPGELISLEDLTRIVDMDGKASQVTIEACMTYGQLCPILDREGFALPNLASLPHISVIGACATATHGSGVGNKTLSTAVSALELVVADGSITSLSRDKDPDVFAGSVVSLGALGIVTRLTIDLVPRFLVKQEVYEGLERATLESHFDEIMSSAYSVSLFWDWRSATINQVWRKEVVEADATEELPSTFFGATLATGPRHPIPGISPEPCTEQMGVPGPWYERLPHFKLAFTPSSGEELQTEYFVARQDACEALSALNSLADRIAALVQITEIRTVAADDLWLSPCYLRDGVGIHFTWKKEWDSVNALLPHIEAALMPFEPRPHWGKLFTMGEDRLTSLYGRAAQFRQLLKAHDPNRKFENAFLDRCGFYN